MKRSGFAACLSIICLLFGCHSGSSDSLSSSIAPKEEIENLHRVHISDSSRAFIENGQTEYAFVGDDKPGISKAMNFCNQYFLEATGSSLPILSDVSNWSLDKQFIIFGHEELWEKAGIAKTEEDLGSSGYQIESAGASIFVRALRKEGYHMAALALLRAILGYEMFSLDTVSFAKTGETLPFISIVEKPDFEYRHYSNTMDPSALYGMGYTDDDIFIPIGGWSIHNTLEVLPPSLYLSDHPDWYAPGAVDLCFTAHGNAEEFEAMVQTIAEVIIPLIDARPDLENFVLSQEDNPTLCSCEACLKDLERYGSKASSQIKLMNRLDDLIQAHLEGTGRVFNLIFLAYHESETAPVKKSIDEKGNVTYSPIDPEMVCHPHVGVEIAPITADYQTSFTDPKNRVFAENIKAWNALTKKIYIYAYETNFRAALYPYNSWSYVYDSFRFYYEQNAVYVFNSGQVFQPCFTAFTTLKDYLDSRALFNVNSSYEEDVDRFFSYYFRAAKDPMRRFYEAVRTYCNHLRLSEGNLTGNIYDVIDSNDYWPQGILQNYLDLIEEANEAILPYREQNVALYETTARHIKIESIFPRYAMATLYANRFNETKLKEMRSSLVEDCRLLGITNHKEHESIETIFAQWGYGV